MTALTPYRREGMFVFMIGYLLVFSANAEIVFGEEGQVVSVESAYLYEHPSLRSVVFATPQAREMALLPLPSYFVATSPLLLRAPVPYLAYPPVIYQSGVNATIRPSNGDLTIYNLNRARAFSQEFYYSGEGLLATPLIYAWPSSIPVLYPPVGGTGGVNQPLRPSNRDNTTYNLERAHRFRMDSYKKP